MARPLQFPNRPSRLFKQFLSSSRKFTPILSICRFINTSSHPLYKTLVLFATISTTPTITGYLIQPKTNMLENKLINEVNEQPFPLCRVRALGVWTSTRRSRRKDAAYLNKIIIIIIKIKEIHTFTQTIRSTTYEEPERDILRNAKTNWINVASSEQDDQSPIHATLTSLIFLK